MIVAGLLLALSMPAYAVERGCHFKTDNAIVCTTAQNAAFAYQNYGFDTKKTDLPYNLKILHELGCAKPYNPHYRDVKIRQTGQDEVSTASGRVSVISAFINNKDTYYYFAKAYVDGTCKRYDVHGVTEESVLKNGKWVNIEIVDKNGKWVVRHK